MSPSFDPTLTDLIATVRNRILITLKRDGRPQSSIVSHAFDPAGATLTISLTDDRAKTRNLRRDPRASYHVTRPDLYAYAVGEAVADLTPVAADPHDATVEALIGYYRAMAGEHPDWDDYRAAMVAERRLLLTLRFDHIYG